MISFFSPAAMTKQYLTRLVDTQRGYMRVFDVFATGDSKMLLFKPIVGFDRNGQGGYNGGSGSSHQAH